VTIERNRYFTGKLLDEADLTQEQNYFREKARRHNRMLHGWGVVCGLCVRPGGVGGEVTIEPGYALDPYGDEIVVEDEVTVELCSEDANGNAVSPCSRPEDDRRGRVRRARGAGRPLYLAIGYAECLSRPVPVGESVEYSRTRESFAIRILTELPASYRQQPPGEPDRHPCPDVRGEPWVVLAEVVLDSNLEVAKVDCHSHRHRVGADRNSPRR
jgi:hypothetical protein